MDDYLPLAQQLNILFDEIKHPEGRAYTLHEVSEATRISPGTISQMRNSKITNPQLSTVRAIARFFKVPLRYFEARSVEECYTVLAEAAQVEESPPLNEITFRALKLSPRARLELLTVLKWIQAAEKQYDEGDFPILPNLEDYEDDAEF